MKNYNPTNYPDYMVDMECTKPHHQQQKRTHNGEEYQCKKSQKRPNSIVDLTGKNSHEII